MRTPKWAPLARLSALLLIAANFVAQSVLAADADKGKRIAAEPMCALSCRRSTKVGFLMSSTLNTHDCGLNRALKRVLVDDMVAAIDVQRLPSDKAGCVMRQEGGCNANVIDAYEAACGSFHLCLVE